LKIVIGAATLVALTFYVPAGTAAAAPTPAPLPAAKHTRLAPADEYFGPLKMSFLGIRNEIHDLTLRYDSEPDKRNQFFGMAVQTEVSLREWERKYPQDGAVVRQVFFLRELYAKFDQPEAQVKRQATEQWLLGTYPKTWYAKNLKVRLAAASPGPAVTPMPAGITPPPATPQPLGLPGSTAPAGSFLPVATPSAKP
jgi:hypothetical protein